MKTFKYYTFLLIITLLTISSCEDPEKNPLVEGEVAPFVRLTLETTGIDLSDQTSSISGTFFTDVPETIETHEVFVAIANGSDSPNFRSLETFDQFPANFSYNQEQIETLFGTLLNPGDAIEFRAVTTGINGTIVETANVGVAPDNFNISQQQGYQFSGVVTCPFLIEDIPTGTYDVVFSTFGNFFGDTLATRTVELGPGPNQITIVEGEFPIEGSDPLIITLDPDTGNVIGVNEDGLAFGNGPSGLPPNTYLLSATPGNVLSCVGLITLGLNFLPFNGNPHQFILRVQ